MNRNLIGGTGVAKYMTRQRKILLDYLSCHTDEKLFAKQIADDLDGKKISVSAVYRNLATLEEDGLVKRSSKAGSLEIFFQYTDAPECRKCLHLSCKRCGRIYHMNTDETELLIDNIAEKVGFSIDKTETVLYGICEACQKS